MYSQFAAGIVVQILMMTAAQVSSVKFTADDVPAGVMLDRSSASVSSISRSDLPQPPLLADPRVASASGSFVSQPPADPAGLSSFTTYASYPPYSPAPYPYPYPQLVHSTSAPAASQDETSRLFGNIGHALNPANLFTCPSGNIVCVISKIAAAVFVLAGLGLAVYLVYALVTGKLGSFGLGR